MVVKIAKPENSVAKTVEKPETKYNFIRKGGKSIIERPPVFSPDGQLLAVIVENTVRVYSVETGECVRTLETESHTDDLIAIEFPKDDRHNLYGCSVKGTITIWTWENGAVLRERIINKPNDLDILHFNLINCRVCLLTLGSPSQRYMQLISYSVKTGQIEVNYRNTQPDYHDMVCVAIGCYDGDQFAAITNGTKMLFIQNLTRPHVREQLLNHTLVRLLSVAVNNGTVAVTDALGRAVVFRGNMFNNKENKGREILHWHFLPAMCCSFSLQGKYLYTGGLEKVLVKWTLGENEKIMMPRLPGHVRFITNNNTYVAATLSNNSIVIANPQLRATCTILECGGLSPLMRTIGGTLIYHPRLKGLLIPGRTGHLQLYSTTTDKVLYNIDITQRNELPAERYNLIPLDTEVTCAAISGDGTWLATSEYRNDGVNYPEEKLKFWRAILKHTPFELNTSVNLSHGGCNVVSLAFDNQGNYCVSAGTDQKFRIWKRESPPGQKRASSFTCITACYYSSGIGNSMSHGILNNIKHHNVNTYGRERYPYLREFPEDDIVLKLKNIHKEHSLVDADVISSGMKKDDDADMGGVAISQDGSLIAAWFGCKLTLWDSHLCNIRTTLAHPALRPRGMQVKFGNQDASHYLVCTTENCLAVWSLLSLTVKWIVQIKPSCLAADRFSNKMAVVTQDNDLFVFTPRSQTPILTRKRLLDPATGVFKQITFGDASDSDIRLFFMRNNSEIYTIEPDKADESRLEVMSWQHQPQSKFSAMVAAQQSSSVQAAKAGDVVAWNAGKAANGAAAQVSYCCIDAMVGAQQSSSVQAAKAGDVVAWNAGKAANGAMAQVSYCCIDAMVGAQQSSSVQAAKAGDVVAWNAGKAANGAAAQVSYCCIDAMVGAQQSSSVQAAKAGDVVAWNAGKAANGAMAQVSYCCIDAMVGAQQSSSVQAAKAGDVVAWNAGKAANGAAAQILSAASHMMPPTSLLSTTFLEQIAGAQDTKNTEEDENEDDETEEKMEVDLEPLSSDEEEEKPLNGPSPKVLELWTPNYEAIKQKRLAKIKKEPFLDLAATNVLVSI